MEGGTAAPEEVDGAKWKISTLVYLCLGGRLGSDCCDLAYY